MIGQWTRHFLIIYVLTISTGFAAAHDTGVPHTHDPAIDTCSAMNNGYILGMQGDHSNAGHGVPTGKAPMAFLIVPIDGDFFPFHWLWHAMKGETLDDNIHLVHEIMHWDDISHAHSGNLPEPGGDLSTTLEQVE